jgi:hypothetical protein
MGVQQFQRYNHTDILTLRMVTLPAVSRISEADAVVGLLSACIASLSPVNVEKIAYILGVWPHHILILGR